MKIRRTRYVTDQNHPAVKEYKAAVEKGLSMQHEPQLSAEMEKRFDDCLEGICYISSCKNQHGDWKIYSQDDDGIEIDLTEEVNGLKHFLATALKEQRAEGAAEERKKILDCLKYEKKWMKQVSRGDAFQDGGINGIEMAIDVVNGKGRKQEVEALAKEDK